MSTVTVLEISTPVTVIDDHPHGAVTVIEGHARGPAGSGGGGGGGLTAEQIRDLVAAFIVAGANVTVTHDDSGDTLTIAASGGGGGLTAEQVLDLVGGALVEGDNIDITVNDGADTITLAVTGLDIADISGLQAALDLKAAAASAVMDGDAAGGVLGGTFPNPSFAADMATQAELDAHTGDTTDAHDASAISVADPFAVFTATDVEGALTEVAFTAGTALGDAANAQTTADAALPKAGGTMAGDIIMGGNKVTDLDDATDPTDAVAFGQVDSIAAGAGIGLDSSTPGVTTVAVATGGAPQAATAGDTVWTFNLGPNNADGKIVVRKNAVLSAGAVELYADKTDTYPKCILTNGGVLFGPGGPTFPNASMTWSATAVLTLSTAALIGLGLTSADTGAMPRSQSVVEANMAASIFA